MIASCSAIGTPQRFSAFLAAGYQSSFSSKSSQALTFWEGRDSRKRAQPTSEERRTASAAITPARRISAPVTSLHPGSNITGIGQFKYKQSLHETVPEV